jgi:hypothetical protein
MCKKVKSPEPPPLNAATTTSPETLSLGIEYVSLPKCSLIARFGFGPAAAIH